MKIKIFRYSGYPVDPANKELLQTERRAVWTKMEERYKGDIQLFQKVGDRVENYLANKFKTVEEVDFIDTPEAALELMEKYGNIMISKSTETDEVVYCILDAQDSAYV